MQQMNKPVMEATGGGFVDDLLTFGGQLGKELTLGAVQVYKMKEQAKLQAELAQYQEQSSQPEIQRQLEPTKGVDHNGRTIAVQKQPVGQASGDKVLFAGITQKQALIGGGALLLVGVAAFAIKG